MRFTAWMVLIATLMLWSGNWIVAIPGAMSSRTARATIQLPDQSRSVAISTIQAVKRIGGGLSPAC